VRVLSIVAMTTGSLAFGVSSASSTVHLRAELGTRFPDSVGFGRSAPNRLVEMVDPYVHDHRPYLDVSHIVWSGWGLKVALGTGATMIYESGAPGSDRPEPARVSLRASDLGRCSRHGNLEYRVLDVRYPSDPQQPFGELGSWQPYPVAQGQPFCGRDPTALLGEGLTGHPVAFASPVATTPTVPLGPYGSYPSPPHPTSVYFVTASGVDCSVAANDPEPNGQGYQTLVGCDVQLWNAATLDETGTVTLCSGVCAGQRGAATVDFPTGSSIVLGPFVCTSLTNGVKCTLTDGVGFLLTNDGGTALGAGPVRHIAQPG
jgi:hypothetical protein